MFQMLNLFCILKVIGIADHTPYFASEENRLFPKITMARSEFSNGKTKDVGDEFEEVRQQLLQIGFHDWVYFKEKKRIAVKL